jgi:hypothetical protein
VTRSTYREYASRAAFGRRLAAESFSAAGAQYSESRRSTMARAAAQS